jgi:hypothetical protein
LHFPSLGYGYACREKAAAGVAKTLLYGNIHCFNCGESHDVKQCPNFAQGFSNTFRSQPLGKWMEILQEEELLKWKYYARDFPNFLQEVRWHKKQCIICGDKPHATGAPTKVEDLLHSIKICSEATEADKQRSSLQWIGQLHKAYHAILKIRASTQATRKQRMNLYVLNLILELQKEETSSQDQTKRLQPYHAELTCTECSTKSQFLVDHQEGCLFRNEYIKHGGTTHVVCKKNYTMEQIFKCLTKWREGGRCLQHILQTYVCCHAHQCHHELL